jgi:hypothetical protein
MDILVTFTLSALLSYFVLIPLVGLLLNLWHGGGTHE